MYERGLAYRKQALVNWCSECGTVLANEQVVDGCCWRHESTPVEQRAIEQWFLRITAYADQLLASINDLEAGWPERVLTHAAQLDRPLGRRRDRFSPGHHRRADSRLHHARRHHLRRHLRDPRARTSAGRASSSSGETKAQVKRMIDARAAKGPGDIEKEGIFTGHHAINPYSGEKIPIWIGNFVLMGYGTGAIMAVPAHDQRDFEFCNQYHIAIRPVIRPVDGALADVATHEGSVRRRRHRRKLRPVLRTRQRRSAPRHERQSRSEKVSANPPSRFASRTGASRGSATGARPSP